MVLLVFDRCDGFQVECRHRVELLRTLRRGSCSFLDVGAYHDMLQLMSTSELVD